MTTVKGLSVLPMDDMQRNAAAEPQTPTSPTQIAQIREAVSTVSVSFTASSVLLTGKRTLGLATRRTPKREMMDRRISSHENGELRSRYPPKLATRGIVKVMTVASLRFRYLKESVWLIVSANN